MNASFALGARYTLPRLMCLCALGFPFVAGSSALGSVSVLGQPEEAYWSDMYFSFGVTGGFNALTRELAFNSYTTTKTKNNITTVLYPAVDLEIGGQFGPGGTDPVPGGTGRHYGPSGTLGGPFSAFLSLTGVTIDDNGKVTSGENGKVTVLYKGGAAGSVGDDYSVGINDVLLEGYVTGVMLNSPMLGTDALDIEFQIIGGELQQPNPDLNGEKFAWINLGLLRISKVGLPDDFSSNFALDGSTMNVFGIPEAGSFAVALGLIASFASIRPKQCPGLILEV